MIKIAKKNFGKNCRIAVISDIHGSYSLLCRLLSNPEVKKADHIVFDGDYISRGRESLRVLRLLFELEKQENVSIVKGNLERLVNWYVNAEPQGILRHFKGHKYNLFRECVEEQGLERIDGETFPGLREMFKERYPDIISWCAELPNALETEYIVFTHAGLGTSENWRESSEQDVMKNDPFIKTGVNTTGKWLVCGHMPTWNSRFSGNSNNCFVDRERRIAFTDGGNQVKDFAQLNALIIDCRDGELGFSTVFESWYPVFVAEKSCVPNLSLISGKDHWPEGELDVLERGEDFTLCKRADGSLIHVASSHLEFSGDKALFIRNTVSELLAVDKGERLELLDAPRGGFIFVRKASGEIGWVSREVLG